MGEIFTIEGYKVFAGMMRIDWGIAVEHIRGKWLYRPDTNCWYCNGHSYPAQCCTIAEVY